MAPIFIARLLRFAQSAFRCINYLVIEQQTPRICYLLNAMNQLITALLAIQLVTADVKSCLFGVLIQRNSVGALLICLYFAQTAF